MKLQAGIAFLLQSRELEALEHTQIIWVAIDQLLDYDWAE